MPFIHNKDNSRGKIRLLKVGLTGLSSLLIKLLSMGIGLFLIPLTANYLGTERFGLWLILNTFLNWIGMADFGLANSLKNALAAADGEQEQEKAKIAVSSVFWMTIGIAFLLGIVFSVAYPTISWSKVFNVTSPLAKSEANIAVIFISILFLVRLVLSIPSHIYYAYQEGYLYNIWDVISNIISISSILIAISWKANLPVLIIAGFGTPLIGNIFSALHIFVWKRSWLMPKITYFRWNQAYSLLKIGFHFWLAQISAILLLQTDLILVAQIFGAVDVAKYGVTLKLFGLISLVQMSFLLPLWAAYTEAIARQDFQWVVKTFKYSLWISMIWVVAASGFLVIFGQEIIKILTNQEIVPDINLLLAMSLTTVIIGFAQSLTMLLNGLGEVKIQALLGLPSGIVNLILSIILGHWLGLAGISIGTSVTIALTLLIYVSSIIKRIKNFNSLSKHEKFS
ncbi:oligosaccharide flippase family protein [Nostoc sp. T09]|uniref:oligosaccharide flippase family protein n=1 Tax=Nostoc sp. T09 TaxID=1932621 RepID=UPI000A39B2FE|nr:oligosaccharide flippase family protein [Nostoc sp. T09]